MEHSPNNVCGYACPQELTMGLLTILLTNHVATGNHSLIPIDVHGMQILEIQTKKRLRTSKHH